MLLTQRTDTQVVAVAASALCCCLVLIANLYSANTDTTMPPPSRDIYAELLYCTRSGPGGYISKFIRVCVFFLSLSNKYVRVCSFLRKHMRAITPNAIIQFRACSRARHFVSCVKFSIFPLERERTRAKAHEQNVMLRWGLEESLGVCSSVKNNV